MQHSLLVSCSVLLMVYATGQALSLGYRGEFSPYDLEGDLADRDLVGGGGDSSGIEKRYFESNACRRCLYRRDDWRSCVTCYSRPGAPVPFYGGFAKRSFEDSPSSYPDTGSLALLDEDKRGVMDYCRCCLASSGNSRCCSRCNITPYHDSFVKRSYQTSFVPLSVTGMGMCDMCCNQDTFDYYCCFYSCAEKRRK